MSEPGDPSPVFLVFARTHDLTGAIIAVALVLAALAGKGVVIAARRWGGSRASRYDLQRSATLFVLDRRGNIVRVVERP